MRARVRVRVRARAGVRVRVRVRVRVGVRVRVRFGSVRVDGPSRSEQGSLGAGDLGDEHHALVLMLEDVAVDHLLRVRLVGAGLGFRLR